jgi:hypothetical protein
MLKVILDCSLKVKLMDAEKLQQIQAHARAIATLLYEETAPEQLTTLEGIESTVRGHLLEHVSPEVGQFLSQLPVAPAVDANDNSKVFLERSALPRNKRSASQSKSGRN